MMLQGNFIKKRHMEIVPGIRVCTKDIMATSPTMKDEDKAVDIKVEVPIKGEDIRDVAVVDTIEEAVVDTIEEAVVDTIEEVVVDTTEEDEGIIIKDHLTIGVMVVLMDTIISQSEDISKDTINE